MTTVKPWLSARTGRFRGRISRVRCEIERSHPNTRQAPELRVPRAPPPPPSPPPPPPLPPRQPEDPDQNAKIFGVNRRFVICFAIGAPIGITWGNYLRSQKIQDELVTTVSYPVSTKEGKRMFERDVWVVKSPKGMTYVAGSDTRGRVYMVDENGVLYYDSGLQSVGWYAIEPDGSMTNIYSEKGKLKTMPVGNINELTTFKVDEIMGVPIDPKEVTMFRDTALKVLPAEVPLVQSKRDEKLMVPPTYIDEGVIELEKKFTLNPFAGRNGGGPFKVEPE